MKATVLGYPRIGQKRELKKQLERYWKGKTSLPELLEVSKLIRKENWLVQQEMGLDSIPSNDFSFYDQVLDMSLTLGCIPERYNSIKQASNPLDLYFAMARGIQWDGYDIRAMEMTKWFDTNYHYIVPEFSKNQVFELYSTKAVDEFKEAKSLGIESRPVLIGPVSFLLLGKEKESGFHRIDLLDQLLPVYLELIEQLTIAGASFIQFDEPYLALDLSDEERAAIYHAYQQIAKAFPELKIFLASYFDCYGDNLSTVLQLPIQVLHLDLTRCPSQLDDLLAYQDFPAELGLSLGVVDGRNVWRNNFEKSLNFVEKAKKIVSKDKLWITSSCSLLHSPYDLDLETKEESLTPEIKQWLAFAKQKVDELVTIKQLAIGKSNKVIRQKLEANKTANLAREESQLIHKDAVKARLSNLQAKDSQRQSAFKIRQAKQKSRLNLPLYPTTTIGSFPQTKEVRSWRSRLKKNAVTRGVYDELIKQEIERSIRIQEELGLDVLVHGEFERNDMVEYFGEKLEGFAFTDFGWVQSYGSRCVKPPIIFGDVHREKAMTVQWSAYAQSLTDKPIKGMLTGPVTILQWSFVRDDQPRSETSKQIALAIRDEVVDLEKAGLKVIQIDEPAIREGLPLQRKDWQGYLDWAVEAFCIAASGVKDETQIHTHICYSEFNDIIQSIANMDADVISIETSRSDMELLDAFVDFRYPNEIGPGVYDIHSPRVPSVEEIEILLANASELLPPEHVWVNPDCGLKTRDWPETKAALRNMVQAAQKLRKQLVVPA